MSHKIPPELWRMVFQYAIRTFPARLKTKWDYDLDDRMWQTWEASEDLDGELDGERPKSRAHVGCSIIRVCRTWRDLGRQYLYEAIDLPQSLRRTESLLKTLKKSATEFGGRGYGRWIKRIDLNSVQIAMAPEQFIDLISLCERLEIITCTPGGMPIAPPIYTHFHRILETQFKHSLRRIRWPGTPGTVPSPKWTTGGPLGLPAIPLHSLDIALGIGLIYALSPCTMESITSLTLRFQTSVFTPKWHFPRLRQLTLVNVTITDALISFVDRHATHLRSMALCSALRPFAGLLYVKELVQAAPGLRSLILREVDMCRLDASHLWEQVTHLGIQDVRDIHPDLDQLDSMIDALDCIPFPNLRRICLLDCTNPVRRHEVHVDLVDWCNAHDVKFVDKHNLSVVLEEIG